MSSKSSLNLFIDTTTKPNPFANIDTGVGKFVTDPVFDDDQLTFVDTTPDDTITPLEDDFETLIDPAANFQKVKEARDDDKPAPSAPAKTSQGVTTSQFQAFRDTGGNDKSSDDKGGCVIATHAVNSGAFTKDTKREAVRWCGKNLHRTWWGEAVRRGYRYYGQKAIDEGNAKNHYQEFKDYVAFGTGKRRTLKTAWTFVYRTVQFFIKGLFNAKR